jgi:hypothetical protein
MLPQHMRGDIPNNNQQFLGECIKYNPVLRYILFKKSGRPTRIGRNPKKRITQSSTKDLEPHMPQ